MAQDKLKFHVHVYKIVSKAEVNVEAKDEEEAMSKALALVKEDGLKFGKSDCQHMAVPFIGHQPI